ncbi:unnamed protein product [Closterium sp. NIES-54]
MLGNPPQSFPPPILPPPSFLHRPASVNNGRIMHDFEAFQGAVDRDPSYATSLSRCLCLSVLPLSHAPPCPSPFSHQWMRDFEAFQAAVDRDPSYAASLSRSLCLALDEFYSNLHAVGVSAVTGGGINEFFTAVEVARKEYMEGYRVDLEKMRAEKEKKEAERQSAEMARFHADSVGDKDALARRTGKMKLDDNGEGIEEEEEDLIEEEMEEDMEDEDDDL